MEMSFSLVKFKRIVLIGIIQLLTKQTILKKRNLFNKENTKIAKKLTVHFIFYVTICSQYF